MVGGGPLNRATNFVGIFFFQIGSANRNRTRGCLEEGQGMGQTSRNSVIRSRLVNVSLAGQEVFFLVKGGFGSFFRVVPLSSYSNPKFAGCGDNKRPCGRAQKQTIEPWALILAVFG